MKSIRKTSQLLDAGLIEPEKIQAIEKVVEKFSVSITPQITSLIQSEATIDPKAVKALKAQFVPSEKELNISPQELADPIGDDIHMVVKGLVHRYPDRCLLLPLLSCPVYCRFCFRREKVGANQKALSQEQLDEALSYIASHTEIWEVILTGGDPLMLNPKKISEIMSALDKIEHVEVVRIHTRIPVVDSNRISEEMLQALKIRKAVYVLLTCNHASELTETAIAACARLVDAGIPMLSQTVLLKDVNDSAETMGNLMRALVKNRIKPYYVHHGDLAKGTSHFRTTIEKGQQIMQALQGNYSGLCQPTYVLDIPGGYGKAPVGHSYIHAEGCSDASAPKSYEIEDFQGQKHIYKDLVEEILA